MTVTIPEWMLWLPVWYLVIGLLLTVPLLAWMNSGIQRLTWYHGWTNWKPYVMSMLAWPVIAWDLWRTPRRNKKALEKWKERNREW